MWFIKKKKKKPTQETNTSDTKPQALPSPNPQEFENWIPYLIDALNLPEGKYSFAPVFDGILLYIYNEGLMWIPKTELVKLSLFKQFSKTILSASPFAVGFFSGGPLASFLSGLSTRILKKQIYQYTFTPPPSTVTAYLQSTIKRIELIPFDFYAGYLKKIKKSPMRKTQSDLKIPQEEGALRIVDVFSEIPKLNEKENQTLSNEELNEKKQNTITQKVMLYRYPSYHEIKPFLDAIKEIGIPIILGKS